MAIKWASAGWRGELDGSMPPTERFYIDFRQKEYPPLVTYGNDPAFTLHTSGDNKPGSHYMSGGHAYYMLDMPSQFVMSIELKPNFNYDTASSQYVCSWYIDPDQHWYFYYSPAADKFMLVYHDAGNQAILSSRQFDDGGAHEDIDQWMRWDIVFDSTTGDTSGSKLYYNRNLEDDTWSNNVDAKSSRFPLFEIRSMDGTEGDYKINFIRLWPDTTYNDVANDHKGNEEEEIYWPLNGHSLGQSRCNITRLVNYYYINKNLGGANTCELGLDSTAGEFADDQYSAFDSSAESFNGLSTQKYLQYRTPVHVESWYSHSFEPVFVGRVNEDYYQRISETGGRSVVTVTAEDAVSECGRKIIEHSTTYEDYDICDTAVESDSLLHVIARLATQRTIKNYLADSSFEGGDITDSWIASGGTFTQDADQLWNSNCGKLDADEASDETVIQTVTFTGTKKLNVGDTYTFSIYLKSAGAASDDIELQEHDAGGSNGATTQTYTLAGGEGWYKWEVSRTITDSDSDRLRVVINVTDGDVIYMDCAMLTQSASSYNWFVLNDNTATAGVESADDADSDSYDTVGFDCDDAAITHPWAIVKEGDDVWSYIKDLAIASLARYYGIDSSGTFVFKPQIDEPGDPTPILTISEAGTLESQLQLQQANKIIVHGIYIVEDTNRKLVWSAQAARMFGDDAQIAVEIANGATWPNPTTYGELWAKYDDNLIGGNIAGPGRTPGMMFGG